MKIREVKSHVLRHALPEAEVFGSSKGWPVAAISAIDIALWDLTGKALRQPVCQLLGGAFRGEVRACATGLYRLASPTPRRRSPRRPRATPRKAFAR